MKKKDSVEYNLFNKFSIDTLESIITILDYSDNKNELYGLIHSVFMEKYEKNMDAFNGINEFDDITRVLACNLAEIKSNAGSMSQEELVILKKILESAKGNLSPEKICESLNAIIEENEDAIDKCLPDAVTNMEIESMLHKLSISALDALYIMTHNAHDKDIDLMKLIESEYEKRGFKIASIVSIIFILFFIYSVIPGLPGSGLLLDYSEETYLKQIFGDNSYFQDGFTYMISLLFIIGGLVYGFASKKFKNNTDVLNGCKEPLARIGTMILLIFVASQFIGIFRKTNLGTVIAGIFANILSTFSFSGIMYLIIVIFIMAICDFFLTGVQAKWIIFSPVIVPALMKANITPQFTQFVMRAVDSMTNGISPLYAYFVIFLGYMNIYNMNEDKPITISGAIKIMLPYFLIISLTWLLLLLGWYIIGLPIGPGVFPTV